ncbi:PREDICTED: zinc finger protein 175-like isoform X2 [Trachymyrmex septentrionalis]|uniref:zinc finger protein 175-like isoform X2 n=1 Tax=Trachymyrmex septentrionalis TaxID=34720 RepID=UPI00084F6110|nr:PREDICTED: zinc finger protein 175-like isoform X2 [Trachymyrmex septentrionalis]
MNNFQKNKRKNISHTMSAKVSAKRRKLDEHSHVSTTPPQSPSMQNNIEDLFGRSKADTSKNYGSMNGSSILTSVIQNSQANAKTYRLIIQIDKIRSKPAPKCKKILPLVTFNNDTKDTETIKSKTKKEPVNKEPCVKGTCKLKKCIYQSKIAFQCEVCDKYFFEMKPLSKSYPCAKCSMSFSDLQSLCIHINKIHFTCDICLIECSSQMMIDKHSKLHINTNSRHPYKCHMCRKVFDQKNNIKQHYLQEHGKINVQNTVIQVSSPMTTILPKQTDYSCTNCNINFTSDQAYRNHTCSNGKKESITCNIKSEKMIPVPSPLTGSQIGILQAVKFSCRVCSKEFDNVKEVDLHTRTHLEVPEEDLKCNICKKLFKNNTIFTEHLKQHLERAHVCPICSKAFINKISLNNHLKTHTKVVE